MELNSREKRAMVRGQLREKRERVMRDRQASEPVSLGVAPVERLVPRRVWPVWSPTKVWIDVPVTIPNLRVECTELSKPCPGELSVYLRRSEQMKGKGHR